MPDDNYAFLEEIAREHRAMREDVSDLTPEEVERIKKTYPMDTPPEYARIGFAEFFDGAL